MNIGLIDVDGHNFPNFALMRISAYHKGRGDQVEWATPFSNYNKVLASKVFTFTTDFNYLTLQTDVIEKGGTGYNISSRLPDDVENSLLMDYSIYPQYPFSIQFFSRGCIRKCPFCLVREKEGYIRAVEPVELNPKGKWIEVLDNNFWQLYINLHQLCKNTALWLVLSHKKGISSIQLSKDIGVTQKTAWFMLHRIRKALGIENDKSNEDDNNNSDGGKLSGTIEVDETFIGGKNKNRHADKKVKACQGRSFKDKIPVFGMIQRNGRIIAKVVSDTKSNTLFSVIHNYVKEGSNLYTDEWNYSDGANIYYNHRNVNHGAGFYGSGDLTTNHIEGFWALVKRSIMGIYYHWSKQHMQRYIDECVYRFNTRSLSDKERFDLFLQNIECRLTYKELVYG